MQTGITYMFTNAVLIIHCSIKTRLLSLSSLCFHNFNIYWPLLFLRFCSDQFVITTRSNHLCCKYFSRAHSATAVPLTQTMTFTRARTPLAVGLPGRILFFRQTRAWPWSSGTESTSLFPAPCPLSACPSPHRQVRAAARGH